MRNPFGGDDACEQARHLLQQAEAAVCDIDGVLLSSGRAIDGAKELLQTRRCVFVSNNSTHTSESLAALFQSLGLTCRKEQFFLAGEHAVEFIASRYSEATVMVLASDDIARLAQKRLRMFDPARGDRPDVVLFCRDRNITFEKIQAAANAVRQGAKVVVSNPDLTHPADGGMIHTETGALWQAVQAQTEGVAQMVVIGKPETYLALRAVEFLGARPQNLVFLGDNLATDAVTAARLGLPFIHVGGAGLRLADLTAPEVRRRV